jgi:hypothetical protein
MVSSVSNDPCNDILIRNVVNANDQGMDVGLVKALAVKWATDARNTRSSWI